jgi:hypothetical protein
MSPPVLQLLISVVPNNITTKTTIMYKPRKATKTSDRNERDRQAGATVQHGQQDAQQSVSAGQRSTSERSSQMQTVQHAPQNSITGRTTSTRRQSQMQVAQASNPYSQPTRSVYSGDPSRMQVVVVQGHFDMVPRRSEFVRNAMMQPPIEYTSEIRPSPYIASIRELPPSLYTIQSQQYRTAPTTEPRRDTRQAPRTQMPPTLYVDRPQGGRTNMIVPGEPHHFGMRTDYLRIEIISTLCRCQDPDSHGDAYTMLNSPRGRDINGRSIDWQEAKKRMLDHYSRDQISHAEEIAAATIHL